jgi:hypothetical protein
MFGRGGAASIPASPAIPTPPWRSHVRDRRPEVFSPLELRRPFRGFLRVAGEQCLLHLPAESELHGSFQILGRVIKFPILNGRLFNCECQFNKPEELRHVNLILQNAMLT